MNARADKTTAAAWRYPATLLGVFTLLWVALAIAPHYRQDWLLENLLVLVAVPVLVVTRHRLRFSNLAYTCIFIFLSIHEIGAHYTYSLVPYDQWFHSDLGFERNHFDRAVHFLYGLLITPAAIELFAHYGRYPRVWALLFPLLFMISHSVVYELIEWGAALVFGGDLGQAYLGTQGDIWDAQKDMALAALGTIITVTGYALAGQLPVRDHQAGTPR